MADGYSVTEDTLRAHADKVRAICGKLDAAQDAANAQGVPEDAFGVLASQVGLPGWFTGSVHERGISAVRNAIARVEEIRAILTEVDEQYAAVEDRRAEAFNRIQP
ncbi:hypothetical protein [Alloactinosynnema sp. L-07]|uniref:hypothetical protein n=1 Tax=Alloactinosynnema sp. L-07 TaxID=1653480 RepID=UPI00065F0188|nr:hypothetical protein [Alloactinosynnema sp. L-07]CRK58171.1 hypothetical protein [Alloactinosynnema sp. L-07]